MESISSVEGARQVAMQEEAKSAAKQHTVAGQQRIIVIREPRSHALLQTAYFPDALSLLHLHGSPTNRHPQARGMNAGGEYKLVAAIGCSQLNGNIWGGEIMFASLSISPQMPRMELLGRFTTPSGCTSVQWVPLQLMKHAEAASVAAIVQGREAADSASSLQQRAEQQQQQQQQQQQHHQQQQQQQQQHQQQHPTENHGLLWGGDSGEVYLDRILFLRFQTASEQGDRTGKSASLKTSISSKTIASRQTSTSSETSASSDGVSASPQVRSHRDQEEEKAAGRKKKKSKKKKGKSKGSQCPQQEPQGQEQQRFQQQDGAEAQQQKSAYGAIPTLADSGPLDDASQHGDKEMAAPAAALSRLPLCRYHAHAGPVTAVDMAPHLLPRPTTADPGGPSAQFLSAGMDGSVKLWELQKDALPLASFTLRGQDGQPCPVHCVRWLQGRPSPLFAAGTGGADRTVQLWDARQPPRHGALLVLDTAQGWDVGEARPRWAGGGAVLGLDWSPRETDWFLLAAGHEGGHLNLWDVRSPGRPISWSVPGPDDSREDRGWAQPSASVGGLTSLRFHHHHHHHHHSGLAAGVGTEGQLWLAAGSDEGSVHMYRVEQAISSSQAAGTAAPAPSSSTSRTVRTFASSSSSSSSSSSTTTTTTTTTTATAATAAAANITTKLSSPSPGAVAGVDAPSYSLVSARYDRGFGDYIRSVEWLPNTGTPQALVACWDSGLYLL